MDTNDLTALKEINYPDNSDPQKISNSARSLWATKVILAILLIGLLGVGRRIAYWPIMTWSVYGLYSKGPPPAEVSRVELRVLTETGETEIIRSSDFFPLGHDGAAETIISQAFEAEEESLRRANRVYLSDQIERMLTPQKITEIQAWRVYWQVKKDSVPPLDNETPTKATSLGQFAPSDYLNILDER